MKNTIYLKNIFNIKDSEIEEVKSKFPKKYETISTIKNDLYRKQKLCSLILLIHVFPNVDESKVFYTKLGKPFINEKNVYYNISHDENYAVLVKDTSEVGLDITSKETFRDVLIGNTTRFNLDEIDYITKHPGSFGLFWSIKEACVKYTGNGISTDLKKINALTIKNTNRFEHTYYKYIDYEDFYISVISDNDYEFEVKDIDARK